MEKPIYDLKKSNDGLRYFFQSKGHKTIQKAVIYFPVGNDEKVYELTFGDVSDDGFVDFMNVSNNHDMKIVIGTVIQTIELFFENFPQKFIYFKGSTDSRTRLYRAILAKHTSSLKPIYQIWGFVENNGFEIFDKNQTYIGYLIQKYYEKEL